MWKRHSTRRRRSAMTGCSSRRRGGAFPSPSPTGPRGSGCGGSSAAWIPAGRRTATRSRRQRSKGAARRVDRRSGPHGIVVCMSLAEFELARSVDRYYTSCIPFYREFLGNHWHTGYYRADGPIGPQDQLRMELRIAASAGIDEHCEVLDVGCGIGGTACHLAACTGARIHGLTPNAAQIELARELARAQRAEDRVCFDQGSAGELPYADASFDVVLFFESPCHFPDRARFFAEVQRVLRPGGRLAGEDWLAAEGLDAAQRARWIPPIC